MHFQCFLVSGYGPLARAKCLFIAAGISRVTLKNAFLSSLKFLFLSNLVFLSVLQIWSSKV